jgi:hypothetical protein
MRRLSRVARASLEDDAFTLVGVPSRIEPFGAEPVRLHPVVSSLSSMGMAAFRTPLAAARFVARFAAA